MNNYVAHPYGVAGNGMNYVQHTAGQEGDVNNYESLMRSSSTSVHKILNGMILELDVVVVECKGFHKWNCGTYGRVVDDLARLGPQPAQLAESRVSASQENHQSRLGEEGR